MLGRALIASVHAAAPRARALASGGGRGLAGGVVGRARLLLNLIRGARGGRESDGGGRARREARRSGTLARLAKQRAAVLSVELNCGAERAQPAPRPHQPLRALQDACNPGGRARSSNPRGERCAPAARTSAARGRRRSPAAMRYSSAPVAVPGVWSVREALQRAGGWDCWKLGVRVGVQGHNAGLHHRHQRLLDALRAGFIRLWWSILPRFGGLSVTRRLRHILFYLRRLLIIHYVSIPSPPEN